METSTDRLYSVSYDGLKVSALPDALIEVVHEQEVGEVLKLSL